MRTNIYIRNRNEEAWAAIDNKSEWVNHKLEGVTDESLRRFAELQTMPPITKKNVDMKFCNHGAVLGLCKKGCK